MKSIFYYFVFFTLFFNVLANENSLEVDIEVDVVETTDPTRERTLVLFKPEVTHRALIGVFIQKFEQKGFRIAGMKFVVASEDLISQHYAEHSKKSFYPALVQRTINQPVVAIVFEGTGVVSEVRRMIGLTNPRSSPIGTLRADFSMQTERNMLHASDSVDNAIAEIQIWFDESELFSYTRAVDEYVYYAN